MAARQASLIRRRRQKIAAQFSRSPSASGDPRRQQSSRHRTAPAHRERRRSWTTWLFRSRALASSGASRSVAAICCRAPPRSPASLPARASIEGFPTVWAQNIKDVAPSRRLLLFRHHRYRPAGERGSRLHGRDAERQRRARQPRRDAADHRRHRRPRILGGAETVPARRDAGVELAKDRELGQDRAALPQGKVSRRPRRLAPGHAALRSAVCRERTRRDRRRSVRSRDRDAEDLQCRHARHPARSIGREIESWSGAVQSGIQGQDGDRRHPRDRHHGRGAWRSNHAATSSMATRAT